MTTELTARIIYIDDERELYPTLVLTGSFGSRGYNIDEDTGELKRVCICAAWNSNECVCGAWDANESENIGWDCDD